MEFNFRLATDKDITRILWIFNDVILNTTAIYQNSIMTDSDIKEWWAKKQKLRLPVFVVEEKGEVVGFTSYGPFREREGYKQTVELAIHIDPRFRGKGLGKKLLSMLIEKAKVDRVHVMVAGIDSENVGSIILHEKFGFEICGELKSSPSMTGAVRESVRMFLLRNVLTKGTPNAPNQTRIYHWFT